MTEYVSAKADRVCGANAYAKIEEEQNNENSGY